MAQRKFDIQSKVAVIGAGLLGIRIAGELALQGCFVHIYDKNSLTVQTIHSTIASHLQELKDNSLLSPQHQIQGEVIVDSLLSSAVAEADIVFEAVSENAGLKSSIFRDIASICSSHTILCTNTLSLPLEEVFNGVPSPERTLGTRFLFPVYLIDEVETSIWDATANRTLENICDFLRVLRKKTFMRQCNEHPRKLSEEEAMEKQKHYHLNA